MKNSVRSGPGPGPVPVRSGPIIYFWTGPGPDRKFFSVQSGLLFNPDQPGPLGALLIGFVQQP